MFLSTNLYHNVLKNNWFNNMNKYTFILIDFDQSHAISICLLYQCISLYVYYVTTGCINVYLFIS